MTKTKPEPIRVTVTVREISAEEEASAEEEVSAEEELPRIPTAKCGSASASASASATIKTAVKSAAVTTVARSTAAVAKVFAYNLGLTTIAANIAIKAQSSAQHFVTREKKTWTEFIVKNERNAPLTIRASIISLTAQWINLVQRVRVSSVPAAAAAAAAAAVKTSAAVAWERTRNVLLLHHHQSPTGCFAGVN